MMSEDAAIHLDNLKDALIQFARQFKPGRDSDINYGPYLRDLLIHTATNYEKLKEELDDIPEIEYKSLYIFLPGNVPMVFFEVLPISVIFNIKTFFKYPRNEKRLYDAFITYLSSKYSVYESFFKGQYMGHLEAERKIDQFDFVFFFGSENLLPILQRTGKPFKFFGPGYSIGIAFSYINEDFVRDVLYFDQQGCLSMKFLFYQKPGIREYTIKTFKSLSSLIPPTNEFSKDRFLYKLLSASRYGEILYQSEDSAIIEMHEDTLPDTTLPDRTLILKQIHREEDIPGFLGQKSSLIQAIATAEPLKLKLLKSYASFITDFGRLQYQPYNFFFKKGVNLHNIFREDNNDYKMAENI